MEQILKSIKRSWTKHFITQVSSLIILAMTFATALFVVHSAGQIRKVFYSWGKVSEATAYLADDATKDEIAEIVKALESQEIVAKASLVTSEEAAKQFSAKYQKLMPALSENTSISPFFPPTIHLDLAHPLRTEQDSLEMQVLSSTIHAQFPKVEAINFGRSWMNKYISLLNLFDNLGWILGGVIFMASLFVTNSVLKTTLYGRKNEIEILELCGATKTQVYASHILNCCFLASLAFIISLFINQAAYLLLGREFANYFPLTAGESAAFLSPAIVVAGFILLNLLVVMLASFTIGGLRVRFIRTPRILQVRKMQGGVAR